MDKKTRTNCEKAPYQQCCSIKVIFYKRKKEAKTKEKLCLFLYPSL